jgi:YebC/PmpR family DNA-binding regulatory protein
VETVTDNNNRTVSEIRHLFSRNGGNLGESGCVGWMFEKRGYFAIDNKEMSEEEFMEVALELGADDISIEEESYEIYSRPEDYGTVRDALEQREIPLVSKELAMLPQNYVQVDADSAPGVLRLMDALEEHDDVQNVWANFDIDADVLSARESG